MTYLSDMTRECETRGCDRRTAILRAIDLDGGSADEFADAAGGGYALIGRYVLAWDAQGFYGFQTCDTPEGARTFFDAVTWQPEEPCPL